MKNSLLIFITVTAFVFISSPLSAEYMVGNADYDTLINGALSRNMNGDFEYGEKLFTSLISQRPDDPTGYFFLGVTMQSRMQDREDWAELDSLMALFEKAVALSEAALKKDKGNGWLLYLQGSACSYIAVLEFEYGSFWTGYSKTKTAVKTLKRSIEADATVYDAYLGLGGYFYWKSNKLSWLSWLPFVKDDREKGLGYLETAREKSRYSRDPATHVLIHTYVEEGCYKKAEKLALGLASGFPEGKLPLWNLVHVYKSRDDWQNAFTCASELLEKLKADQHQTKYNLVEGYYLVIEAAYNLEDRARCKQLCSEALSLELSKEDREEQAEKLGWIGEIRGTD
ncbi:hypothetical protein JXI42_05515 [bacterium]|nr:hypothetical protein [bacterium]